MSTDASIDVNTEFDMYLDESPILKNLIGRRRLSSEAKNEILASPDLEEFLVNYDIYGGEQGSLSADLGRRILKDAFANGFSANGVAVALDNIAFYNEGLRKYKYNFFNALYYNEVETGEHPSEEIYEKNAVNAEKNEKMRQYYE